MTKAKTDLLEPLRALLCDASKWTTGTYARNAAGQPVEWKDATAVCWCLDGAILKAYPRIATDARMKVFTALRNRVNPIGAACPSLAGWQDKHSFEEIQELLREPISVN